MIGILLLNCTVKTLSIRQILTAGKAPISRGYGLSHLLEITSICVWGAICFFIKKKWVVKTLRVVKRHY